MPITKDEALAATSSDPRAYGLPPDVDPDALARVRESATETIARGVAANDQYWNSRNHLDQLRAKADGHGTVPPHPDNSGRSQAVTVADAESTAIEEPPTASHMQAPALASGDAETVRALREQLRAAGQTPVA